ncbi:hypothetical protein Tco_1503627 [Tanacetum coccineum]
MANGADIAAIKNRGCGTFDLRVDEFCGSKVTISVQRNHRKSRCEENSSSPINGSRNAEIPGPRRSTYFTKQQDNPTGMVSELDAQPPDAIQAMEEKIKVAIHPEYPKQTVAIDSTLTEDGRKALLNVREGCSPVRQKKRGQAPKRNKAIQEEVEKLVDTGTMKEVHYHSWLSNPVMVKKHDDSWRMCVDFKDLNKACPKDSYPLPKIDWKM